MASRTTPAGQLRHRVTVQKPVPTLSEDNGETVMVPTDVATVWASIMPAGGNESWSADQVSPEVTHKVVTRHGSHLDGYDSSWRLVFGLRIFEVESVILRDEVSGTFIDWSCKEAGRLTTDPEPVEIAGV